MIQKLHTWAVVAALAALGVLGIPSRASAGFTITLQEGASTKTIVDNGNGTGGAQGDFADNNSTSGTIDGGTITFGGFEIKIVGASNNVPGDPYEGTLDLTTFKITNKTAGTNTLTVTVFADGYTQPTSAHPLTLEDQISVDGTNPSFTVTSQSTGTGNGGSGTSASTTLATITQPPANGDADNKAYFTAGNTAGNAYSLTKVVTIKMKQGTATLSVTGETNAIAPAPPAWSLALSGLVCCVPFCWLRRRSLTPAAA